MPEEPSPIGGDLLAFSISHKSLTLFVILLASTATRSTISSGSFIFKTNRLCFWIHVMRFNCLFASSAF